MLKNIDKKYLKILLIVIVIPIVLILFLMLIRGCSSSKSSYSDYEKKMVSAAEKYFKKKNMLPVTEGGTVTVTLDELVKDDIIKNPDKKLGDKNCTGTVTVRNNGVSVKENKGGLYLYIPDLKCDSYKTVHLIDKLKGDIVTEKSGLYETGDGYVYKGAKVNNYVKFMDKDYRILSIDKDGILKLVKVKQEKKTVNWDNKYNPEKKQISGKNDYSDSNIIDSLSEIYGKMKDNQKKHLLAYNVCYGNRSVSYKNVDKVNECSKILENQFVSILNVYDYAMASYDVNCNAYNSPSCRNYNYLYNTLDTTWLMNGNADNTYEVYYYYSGKIYINKANTNLNINLVMYLDGNEIYTKGDGSLNNPYIIK